MYKHITINKKLNILKCKASFAIVLEYELLRYYYCYSIALGSL